MDLVFIYGAPGVGKLTVANELSSITGYPVFHNHIAIDLVKSIYGYGNRKSEDLIRAVNLSAITLSASKGVSTIFTYARPNDKEFIKAVIGIVESNGGRVLFVQLKCDEASLRKRIKSRKGTGYGKITDNVRFAKFKRQHGPFRRITIRKGISIDTSGVSPKHAALRISSDLKLKKSQPIGAVAD